MNNYQNFVVKTGFFRKSTQGRNLSYLLMGIIEEYGEIYELKNEENLDDKNKELGDLSWYLTAICNEIGILLTDLFKYQNCDYDENKMILYFSYLSGIVKRIIRDDNEILIEDKKKEMIKYLSYILHFILKECNNNDTTFQNILTINMNKIKKRIENNTICGSGNNR